MLEWFHALPVINCEHVASPVRIHETLGEAHELVFPRAEQEIKLWVSEVMIKLLQPIGALHMSLKVRLHRILAPVSGDRHLEP